MIRLRPHHGLCIRHFTGRGYDQRFTENMTAVVGALKGDPAQEIVIVEDADVLCGCCPNLVGGRCVTQEKVSGYDATCLRLCGLRFGQRVRWDAFQDAISTKVLGEHELAEVCKECEWLSVCVEVGARTP